jgi:hypothetical protein
LARSTKGRRAVKNTKLMIALVAVAVAVVPPAEATFGGSLQRGVTYTFQINDQSSGGTAVMLQAVTRGRLRVKDTRTVAVLETIQMTFTVPPTATRVVLVLDPSRGGATEVKLLRGTSLLTTDTYEDAHTEVVYDVVS